MEQATDLLEIIHTDVCDPMSVDARGKYRYFLTFIDDLSIYEYIYLMKHKSETFEKFKAFQSEVENHHNKKIKFLTIRSWWRIFKSRIWYALKEMWNRFTTNAAWNTSA